MSTRNDTPDSASVPTRLVNISAPGKRSSVESEPSREVANNVSFRLLWTLHLRHGQHDGRHVGQFTCQTQREDFRNARGAEIHTHDTCTGNMHTSDLLVNNCSVNTASHLWSVLHRLRVFHCSWATKMWLLRRWVWDSTEVIKYLSNATIEASVTSVA